MNFRYIVLVLGIVCSMPVQSMAKDPKNIPILSSWSAESIKNHPAMAPYNSHYNEIATRAQSMRDKDSTGEKENWQRVIAYYKSMADFTHKTQWGDRGLVHTTNYNRPFSSDELTTIKEKSKILADAFTAQNKAETRTRSWWNRARWGLTALMLPVSGFTLWRYIQSPNSVTQKRAVVGTALLAGAAIASKAAHNRSGKAQKQSDDRYKIIGGLLAKHTPQAPATHTNAAAVTNVKNLDMSGQKEAAAQYERERSAREAENAKVQASLERAMKQFSDNGPINWEEEEEADDQNTRLKIADLDVQIDAAHAQLKPKRDKEQQQREEPCKTQ